MIRKADLLHDVREQRSVAASEFEFRSKGNSLLFSGHASTFDQGYEVNGGPSSPMGWTEFVSRDAFKKTLADTPHVHLLENHTGMPLASTKSGTLQLSTDSRGLVAESSLDLRDPQVQSLAVKMERGDVDEMSFAFRVLAQSWSDDDTERSLDEVSLHKGDVSIVSFGANPHTSLTATMRGAMRMLQNGELDENQLAEVRAMAHDVDAAIAALRADKPYGDVAYADPKNGKYPIDTKEHVKAAWSYINMPKNQTGYTASELSAIKGRIKSAAKKFGITISSDEHNSGAIFVGVVNRDSSVSDENGTGSGPSLARQVHDLSTAAGADCGANSMGMEYDSLRSLSVTEDYAPDVEGEDMLDSGQGPRDSLAQAVHDLVADAAHEDAAAAAGHAETPAGDPLDRLSLSDAIGMTTRGNLTLAEAARMMRPEDAPERLTLADAQRLAS